MDVILTAFAEALQGLAELTGLDMTALGKTLDERIIDGLENGKAQKFECTMELCWKAVKVALRALGKVKCNLYDVKSALLADQVDGRL